MLFKKSSIFFFTMEKQTLSLEHNFRPSSSHTKNCPTIVMLHGFGSDDNDLFSFSNELPNEYMIISLKAPLKLQPFGNAWYSIYFDQDNGKFSDNDQAIESRELVVKCIDEIIIKYHADKNNITLIGFSQGTILSFAVALSYPEMIKNVIGLSGYIDKEILVDGYSEKDHNDLNVYSSH